MINSIAIQCHPHSQSFSTTSQAASVAKRPHLRMKVNVIYRIDFGVGSMTPQTKKTKINKRKHRMRFWRGWGSAWINKNTNEVSGSTRRDLHYVLGCAIGLASWLETGTWLIWPIQSDGGENPVKARYYGTTLQNHPNRCVWKYPPFQKKTWIFPPPLRVNPPRQRHRHPTKSPAALTATALEGKVLRGVLDVCNGAAPLNRSNGIARLVRKGTSILMAVTHGDPKCNVPSRPSTCLKGNAWLTSLESMELYGFPAFPQMLGQVPSGQSLKRM